MQVEAPTQFCPRCKTWKPLNEFTPSRQGRPGAPCRDCQNTDMRQRIAKARLLMCVIEGCDKVGTYHLKRQNLVFCRAHYDQHLKTRAGRAKCQTLWCANPVDSKGYCKNCYQRLHRQDPLRPRCFVEHCQNPAVKRGLCQSHYTYPYLMARLRQTLRIDLVRIGDLIQRRGRICHLCGKDVASTPSVDHLIPRMHGILIDAWWNSAVACRRCNEFRSDQLLPDNWPLVKEAQLEFGSVLIALFTGQWGIRRAKEPASADGTGPSESEGPY